MSQILVIGSIHLDIIADYRPDTALNIDKIGDLAYSIGGVGFNIISNLITHDRQAKFYSYINPKSISGHLALKELRARGIPLDHIHKSIDLPESGFVAQLENGKLKSAVSCVGIEYIQLDKEDLRTAIQGSKILIIDCNLSEGQVREVLDLAHENPQKRIFATCVSESKVRRVANLGLGSEKYLEAVFMNRAEALKVISNQLDNLSDVSVKEICNIFSSKAVVVTNGKAGYTVFLISGKYFEFPQSPFPGVINELGAGDALSAGVCAYAQANPDKEIDWKECDQTIKSFVIRVLKTKPTTVSLNTSASMLSMEARESILAGSFFVGSILMLLAGLEFRSVGWFFAAFFGTPLFSGASGGIVRIILDRFSESGRRSSKSISVAITLGAIAGFLTALLFVLAQRVSNQDGFKFDQGNVPDGVVWLIPFLLVLAFIGGLTLEGVFGKLRQTEVLKVDVLK